MIMTTRTRLASLLATPTGPREVLRVILNLLGNSNTLRIVRPPAEIIENHTYEPTLYDLRELTEPVDPWLWNSATMYVPVIVIYSQEESTHGRAV
jgi:hypothetical protein